MKTSAVKLGALRHPHVGDGTVELPLSIDLKITKAYESLLYMRLDRVFELLVVVGARPIAQTDSANLARILQAHITQQLIPVDVTPPAITGTVDVGQTLTVTPGTWSNPDVTLGYQWQRCDGTGANCAAIAGATLDDVCGRRHRRGFATFSVVETATDRFGAPTATSTVTSRGARRRLRCLHPARRPRPEPSGALHCGQHIHTGAPGFDVVGSPVELQAEVPVGLVNQPETTQVRIIISHSLPSLKRLGRVAPGPGPGTGIN